MATKRLWAAAAALAVLVLLYAAPSSMATSPDDFAGEAFNILPPGQDGSLILSPHSTDQIPLYDGLTPKFDNITASDLPNFFKRNVFGLDGQSPERVENPPARPGLTIERDSFGVPHVTASARDDVMYGAGWVAYEDRGFFMDLLRSPGKLAAIDAPGIDPFALFCAYHLGITEDGGYRFQNIHQVAKRFKTNAGVIKQVLTEFGMDSDAIDLQRKITPRGMSAWSPPNGPLMTVMSAVWSVARSSATSFVEGAVGGPVPSASRRPDPSGRIATAPAAVVNSGEAVPGG